MEQYNGDLLPYCYDDWIQAERERLRRSFLQSLMRLVDLFEAERQYPAAVHYAGLLVYHHPYDEAPYRRLMQLHLLNDDRAAALRAYHACALMLEHELDVPPSAATQELHHRLLHTTQELPLAPAQPMAAPASMLVGRQLDWQTLRRLWATSQTGHPHFVCIAGEPGIGKSRLAEELLAHVQKQGFAAAHARAYAAEGRLAYDPIVAWLRAEALRRRLQRLDDIWLMEVARLLPELLAKHPTWSPLQPLTDHWQRRRFFEALARTFLSNSEPLLLVLDDLQWCDRETLEWIHYLLRYDPRSPLLVVGTARPGEIDAEHPFTALLHDLRQTGQATEIELTPLTSEETAHLAEQLTGHTLESGQIALAQQVTEGNPLFVEEMVRAGMLGSLSPADSSLPRDPSSGDPALPPKLHAVIEARLARLSPPARTLAALAATVGRSFTMDILRHAGDMGEDPLILILDEIWQRRIVRSQGDNRYDFSHDKIREVAYASLGPARRGAAHRRVAEALQHLHAADLDAVSGQIAAHYDQAGCWVEAADAYRRAAAVARAIFAHDEVVSALNKALTALHHIADRAETAQREIDLLLDLGVALFFQGWDNAAAIAETWRQAWTLAHAAGTRFQQVRAIHAYYGAAFGAGAWHKALAYNEQAIALAEGIDDPFLWLNLLSGQGWLLLNTGRPAQALHYYERTLTLFARPMPVSFAWFATNTPVETLLRSAQCLWLLGYPDQARIRCAEAMQQVIQTDMVQREAAVSIAAELAYYLRDGEQTSAMGRELTLLSAQRVHPDDERAGKLWSAWARLQQNRHADGNALVETAAAQFPWNDNWTGNTHWCSALAEIRATEGDVSGALQVVEETLAYATKSDNCFWSSHLLTLKGNLWQRLEFPAAEVETCYQMALDLARQQSAKSLELRAALSLNRLWQAQGKHAAARTLLAEIYSWFDEGFETHDLRDAAALLAQHR